MDRASVRQLATSLGLPIQADDLDEVTVRLDTLIAEIERLDGADADTRPGR